jgi:2-polyprenyl-3-methyl-5-hydroxy-6-metoxy-1,4-benzoquinol methylase
MTMHRDDLVAVYNNYYEHNPHKWVSEDRNRFAAGVLTEHMSNPKRILDVGCGNGHTLAYLAHTYPEAQLYGIDLSPVACKIASDTVTDATIMTGFIEDFELGVQFDLILCMGVAEHFLKIEDGLVAINRLLSKRGLFYLEVPNCLSYSPGDVGFRRTKTGSHQAEWHLSRPAWELIISLCGYKIVQSCDGEIPSWEFVWMLKGNQCGTML